jgi:predicted glycosyltransferase
MDKAGRPIPLPGDENKSSIIARRAAEILQFCRAWRPNCLLVDQHPLGLGGELKDVLLDHDLAAMQVVWGLPYAQGVPTRNYRNPLLREAMSRYQCLLAYGDQEFDDILSTFEPGILPPRVEYAGIVTSRPTVAKSSNRNRVVSLCGGGFGATEFYRLIAKAADFLGDYSLRMHAGPASDKSKLIELAGERNFEVVGPGNLDQALEDAAVVISRAGYNTAFHLIQTELPLILVPQELGYDDQPHRSQRLSQLSNVWVIREKSHKFVEELGEAIQLALLSEHRPRGISMRLDGASRVANLLSEMSRESSRECRQ